VKKTLSRFVVALSVVLIVSPVLGLTWLAFELFHPETFAFSTTDHPLEWIKVTTSPTTTNLLGGVRTRGETIFYIKSATRQWKRISFSDKTNRPHLAVLSPDEVLLAGQQTNGAPIFVGAVFKRGVEGPAALVPDSDYIFPVPSGGFVATRLDRDAQFQPKGITIEKYNSTGKRTGTSSISIPGELVSCDWGPTDRLIGDDLVYGASMCHAPSGLYLASPKGIQQIAHYKGSAKEDYENLSSRTTAPNWYHGSWPH